jgi:hypothetical protein
MMLRKKKEEKRRIISPNMPSLSTQNNPRELIPRRYHNSLRCLDKSNRRGDIGLISSYLFPHE